MQGHDINTHIFKSKDLELAYIQSAPPWEVLRYFEIASRLERASPYYRIGISITNSGGFVWTDQLENAAFERNEPIIDISLASLASSPMIEKLLQRHQASSPEKPYEVQLAVINPNETDWEHDRKVPEEHKYVTTFYERIVLSALTNKYPVSERYGSTSNWLKYSWEWLTKYGKQGHFAALFSNPSCPREIIDNILSDLHCPYKPRYIELLNFGLSAKILSRLPEDDETGPDLAAHRTIRLFWSFLTKIDPTDFWVVREIASNVDNFPAFEIDFKEYGIRDYGEPGYDRI